MVWHYRVFKVIEGRERYFCIKEFYPEFGKVIGKKSRKGNTWIADPSVPFGETKKELIRDLRAMLEDAKKYPVKVEKIKPVIQESSKRLARLGGTEKALRLVRRRRLK